MGNVWFASDFHYNHANICRGISRWPDLNSTRDFKSLHQMNQAIIDGINTNVKEGDTLYCLGDWSFGGRQAIEDFRISIICNDVHLTYGNHDHNIMKDRTYRSMFSSTTFMNTVIINGQEITLNHFKMHVWDHIGKGAWHLYGHSHGTFQNEGSHGKCMDVGIDATYKRIGEYRPLHFDEVKKIMDKREIILVDHHNKHSN